MLTAAIVGRAWRPPRGSPIEAALARLHAGERASMTDPRAADACTTIAPIRDEPAKSRNSRVLRRMGLIGLEVAIEALADPRDQRFVVRQQFDAATTPSTARVGELDRHRLGARVSSHCADATGVLSPSARARRPAGRHTVGEVCRGVGQTGGLPVRTMIRSASARKPR